MKRKKDHKLKLGFFVLKNLHLSPEVQSWGQAAEGTERNKIICLAN